MHVLLHFNYLAPWAYIGESGKNLPFSFILFKLKLLFFVCVFQIANFVFVNYYVLEQLLKIWANGPRRYISDNANIFDCIFTSALVVSLFLNFSQLCVQIHMYLQKNQLWLCFYICTDYKLVLISFYNFLYKYANKTSKEYYLYTDRFFLIPTFLFSLSLFLQDMEHYYWHTCHANWTIIILTINNHLCLPVTCCFTGRRALFCNTL
jgi:hypothetical protein